MNTKKLLKADRLLYEIENYCDDNYIDIDMDEEYIELNSLVTEYSFGNRKININGLLRDVKMFRDKIIKWR